MRAWRNWQTRKFQVLVREISCEFKSRRPHQLKTCRAVHVFRSATLLSERFDYADASANHFHNYFNGEYMRIFLIRHGESTQNTYENLENFPDFKVPLTKNGIYQAEECGDFLANYFDVNKLNKQKTILLVSPFQRTRQTAKKINDKLKIEKVKEDPLLVERQYGLFDNITYDERAKYNNSHNYANWMYENGGHFFTKFPLGESPFDVYVRAKLFLESCLKKIGNEYENIVIISHGMFLKTLQMACMNYSIEWYDAEPKMSNCSVKRIDFDGKDFVDIQYIFKGAEIDK